MTSLAMTEEPARRYSYAVDVDATSDSHFFAGLSGEIEEGGLFFATYRSLSVGTTMDLEIFLPGPRGARPVRASGTVRWVRDDGPDHPRGVGIVFETLPTESRRRIDLFLKSRPALYYECA